MSFLGIIGKIKRHPDIHHLKLAFATERPPPPQVVQQELFMAAEESGKYF